MTRVLVTGASTGIGLATAAALLDDGHDVVVHARSADRLPTGLVRRGARPVTADLGDLGAVTALADTLGALDPVDAVVHNAHVTQTWLATSDDPRALEGGGYWFHRQRSAPDARVLDTALQDRLVEVLASITGVAPPG